MTRSSMFDTAVFVLYIVAIVCSIIELGLTGYVASVLDDRYYNYYGSSAYESRTDFLLFNSIWTILVSAVLLAFPYTIGRFASKIASPLTLSLNAITWIFWLAGFAAFADVFIGAPNGIPGAILAFAVILWLIFTAILIFNILTAVGVVSSDRPGHSTLTRKTTVP